MFVVASPRNRPDHRLCLTATSAATPGEEDLYTNTHNTNHNYHHKTSDIDRVALNRNYHNDNNFNIHDPSTASDEYFEGGENIHHNRNSNEDISPGYKSDNSHYDPSELYIDDTFSDYNTDGSYTNDRGPNRPSERAINHLASLSHNRTLVVTAHAHSCPRQHVPPTTFLSVNLTTKSK